MSRIVASLLVVISIIAVIHSTKVNGNPERIQAKGINLISVVGQSISVKSAGAAEFKKKVLE